MLDSPNVLTLAVFAPLLVLVGALGFVIPSNKSVTSGAAPYNLFHILFGLLGAALVLHNDVTAARAFNVGFGLVDLYQAAASRLRLFPWPYFKWRPMDDLLHVVIGLLLLLVGVVGR